MYTGGTIGMIQQPDSKALKPFDFRYLADQIPEIARLNCELKSWTLEPPVDSSDMDVSIWSEMAHVIEDHYHQFDGFVILHGSDTMAYTASALSFMLEHLAKPVILTGSQLPIGVTRTDGKENLLTSVEIAAARNKDGSPVVPEVAVYFEYKLFRGNRTHKFSAENFEAFNSANYPVLAEAGVHIKYNRNAILGVDPFEARQGLIVRDHLENNVASLFLYPSISRDMVQMVTENPHVKAIVLRSFGAGNATTKDWFLEDIRAAVDRGLYVLNVTQCQTGTVNQTLYQAGEGLEKAGVIGGADITVESAITKLMYLLGQELTREEIIDALRRPLRGEISEQED